MIPSMTSFSFVKRMHHRREDKTLRLSAATQSNVPILAQSGSRFSLLQIATADTIPVMRIAAPTVRNVAYRNFRVESETEPEAW